MANYNLDAITHAMPRVTLRGRQYTMAPVTPASLAAIQRHRKALGEVANAWLDESGEVQAEFREGLIGLIEAVFPQVPHWLVFGGYRSRLHRLLGRREPGLDLRTLAAFVQAIYQEVENLLPQEGDLKNAVEGAG